MCSLQLQHPRIPLLLHRYTYPARHSLQNTLPLRTMKHTSLHTRVTDIVIQLLLIHTCVLHAHRKFQRLLPLRCAVPFCFDSSLCEKTICVPGQYEGGRAWSWKHNWNIYEEGGTSKGCDVTCRTMAIEILCVRDAQLRNRLLGVALIMQMNLPDELYEKYKVWLCGLLWYARLVYLLPWIWGFDCLGQVGLRKFLHAAVEEDVDVPQLRFALRKGKLLLTPKLVTQEILEGLLLLFLTLWWISKVG